MLFESQPNLLAVEVKPRDESNSKKDHDRAKLGGYLSEHKYTFAALVTYGTGEGARFDSVRD